MRTKFQGGDGTWNGDPLRTLLIRNHSVGLFGSTGSKSITLIGGECPAASVDVQGANAGVASLKSFFSSLGRPRRAGRRNQHQLQVEGATKLEAEAEVCCTKLEAEVGTF